MGGRGRVVLQAVVWFAAANFAALVVSAVAMLATGSAGVLRLGGAARVLRGSAGAVPNEELAALREARMKLEGRRDEAALMKAWSEYDAERAAFDSRMDREKKVLFALRDEAKGYLEASTKARAALGEERAAEARRREQEREELRRSASDKVKRVYRYMRPDEVARDLEARLAADRAAEVAEIVRAMNDRTAAEVLEAMTDPARRMQVYDALAGIEGAVDRP